MELLWELIKFLGEPAFYGSVGLLVGWNVLPQPAFVKKYYNVAATWVMSKF